MTRAEWFERTCGLVILRVDCTLVSAETISAVTGEVTARYDCLQDLQAGRAYWAGRDPDMAQALDIAAAALEV